MKFPLSGLLALAILQQPLVTGSSSSDLSHGFQNSKRIFSQGGNARCITGLVPVSIIANNSNFVLDQPTNQTVLSAYVQELFEANSTLAARAIDGRRQVTGDFKVNATLCVPQNSSSIPSTVQILTHGSGLQKNYWDIAPSFSYVDAAARSGYATLSYDRLGVGGSDKPDPLQVVQVPADAEVLHALTRRLRSGKIGPRAFRHIISVGHSYGAVLVIRQAMTYLDDADAAVVTGLSSAIPYLAQTFYGLDLTIAASTGRRGFNDLPSGYVVTNNEIGFQQAYFRFPYFDEKVFRTLFRTSSASTLGQFINLGDFTISTNYTRPVYWINGIEDVPACGALCTGNGSPDITAQSLATYFPNADRRSASFNIPNTGHILTAHYSAEEGFDRILSWLKGIGF